MQPSLRKAAILVTALDSASAEAMLAQLGPKAAARIRDAARGLGQVAPSEQQAVLAEFLADDTAPDGKSAVTPAERLAAGGQDEVVLEHADRPPAPRRPFQFLEAVDVARLAERLLPEHPQTIALVAAHAPRRLAAELLWRLPEALRTEVLIRVIDWQGTDPQLLAELEQELEMSLASASAVPSRAEGLAAAREILEAVTPSERGELLDSLLRRDERKAELLTHSLGEANHDEAANAREQRDAPGEMSPAEETEEAPPLKVFAPPVDEDEPAAICEQEPPIRFPEFVRFDDRTLSRVLGAADPQTTLLALTGASPPLMGRVLRRLTVKQARQLQRRMAAQGPFRLRDIELAQLELARVAGRLAAQGLIRLPPRRQAAS